MLTASFCFNLGTQRRTKKVVTHVQTEVSEDKKLKATIKKFGKYNLLVA